MYKHWVNYSAATLVLISIGASQTALAAKGGSYQSNGSVEFIPSSTITPPVDPENPDPEITPPVTPTPPPGITDPPGPGTSGPLSIDYASSFSFGQNKITNKNEIYYAEAQGFTGGLEGQYRGNYAQITDNRGTVGGWTLSLKQEGQFTSTSAKNYKTLTGAQIEIKDSTAVSSSEGVEIPKVTNAKLNPDGNSSIIMSAEAGAGAGTWVDRFGKAEEVEIDGKKVQKNKAITLSIPGKTPKEATQYKTKLTWTLTDTPGK